MNEKQDDSYTDSNRENFSNNLHKSIAKPKVAEFGSTFVNSSNDDSINFSLNCQTKAASVDNDNLDVGELFLNGSNYRNENKILQTPILDCKFRNDVDKCVLSSIFRDSKVISSTPIVNSGHKDYYKTPERKRRLFDHACSSTQKYSTPFTLNSDSKLIPVSSPTSSEKLKFNESRILNDSSSIYYQKSNLSKSSPISGFSEIEESFDKTLCNTNKFNSVTVHENDRVCDEQTSILDNSYNTNLKFESFDLLPGIKPLND